MSENTENKAVPLQRAALVSEYRRISRALADETQPESAARPLRRALESVNAKIEALDAAAVRS